MASVERSDNWLVQYQTLEKKAFELLCSIRDELVQKVQNVVSVQYMRDDDFQHFRDRKENDLHALCELSDGYYYHLRVYIQHMLTRARSEQLESADAFTFDTVELTAYLKDQPQQHGGTHALRQDWYPWDAESIAEEIVQQNPEIFEAI